MEDDKQTPRGRETKEMGASGRKGGGRAKKREKIMYIDVFVMKQKAKLNESEFVCWTPLLVY